MATTITDEQLEQLLRTTQAYSVVLLRWGPERHMEGVEAIRWEHSRRMASAPRRRTNADRLPRQSHAKQC